MADNKSKEAMTFEAGEVLILITVVVLIVAVIVATLGFRLPSGDLGDVATLMFGAASVAMFVLSFLVAVAAIFGWQSLRRAIDEKVATAVKEVRVDVQHEINARVHSGLALILGRICRTERSLDVQRKDLLEAAIIHSRRSIKYYQELKGVDEDRFNVVRNNLAFYLALRGQLADGQYALGLTKELQEWALAYENYDATLTICLTTLRFAETASQREAARRILRQIRDDPGASEHEKKEAEKILASSSEQDQLELGTA